MLDARNQIAFDALERAYLYDFPEPSDEEVLVTCEECGEAFTKDEIIRMFDGEQCCRSCIRNMYEKNRITRKEFEFYEV